MAEATRSKIKRVRAASRFATSCSDEAMAIIPLASKQKRRFVKQKKRRFSNLVGEEEEEKKNDAPVVDAKGQHVDGDGDVSGFGIVAECKQLDMSWIDHGGFTDNLGLKMERGTTSMPHGPLFPMEKKAGNIPTSQILDSFDEQFKINRWYLGSFFTIAFHMPQTLIGVGFDILDVPDVDKEFTVNASKIITINKLPKLGAQEDVLRIQIMNYFSSFGKIECIDVVDYPDSDHSLGIISYESDSSVEKVLSIPEHFVYNDAAVGLRKAVIATCFYPPAGEDWE